MREMTSEIMMYGNAWIKQFEKDDKIYVFCINFQGLILANHLKLLGKNVEYLDNDDKKNGLSILGQKCTAPEYADPKYPCIIAAANMQNRKDIKEQLLRLGFRDVFFVDEEYVHEWIEGWAPSMPDDLYIKIFWYFRKGYEIDLENPRTFNEKIQWLKLHDRRHEYVNMTDKYEVKKFVARTIGSQYIIPTLGIYDSFDEIDFDVLPEQFVMKCTHDSGGIEICTDKFKFDFNEAERHMKQCLDVNYFYYEREYSYKDIRPRIIIEKYMSDKTGGLNDYKIFCFNGEPKIIQVDVDRTTEHRRNLYSTEWELLDFALCYPNVLPGVVIEKPDCLNELLEAARKLSKGIPHVRTDFYIIDNHIYFGEMTFYHGGGYEKFTPEEWDKKLGDYITII